MLPLTTPDFMSETEIAALPTGTELEVYVPVKYRKDPKYWWIPVHDLEDDKAAQLTDEGLSQYQVVPSVGKQVKKILKELEEYCPICPLRNKVVQYLVENHISLTRINKGPLSILGVSHSQMQTLAEYAVGTVVVIDFSSFKVYVRSSSGTWVNGKGLSSMPKGSRYLVFSEEN